MFEGLKCAKKGLFIPDYFISKFPAIFEYWKKDLEKLILSLTKGVMFYEYIDSWDKHNKTLPPKEKLFSKLKNKGISDED